MTTRQLSATTAEPQRLHMSYDEYIAWADEDVHAEWVDGEVIVQMPPYDVHQIVLNFLNHLLAQYVEFQELGVVLIAPFEMRLLSEKSARQPDILVVTTESLGRLSRERLEGPADLVVEIVSRDSVRRDRHDKLHEYRRAGVREYWVVDPRPGRNRADFYRLDAAGEYELYATDEDEQVASAVLPGFWLRPSWLWLESKPPVMTAFLEILSPEQRERFRRLVAGEG